MAKRLTLLNAAYTAVGLAVATGVGIYVYRRLRDRRMGRGDASGDMADGAHDLRRPARQAGRAIQRTTRQVGKAVRRGAEDVGDAAEDAVDTTRELVAGDI